MRFRCTCSWALASDLGFCIRVSISDAARSIFEIVFCCSVRKLLIALLAAKYFPVNSFFRVVSRELTIQQLFGAGNSAFWYSDNIPLDGIMKRPEEFQLQVPHEQKCAHYRLVPFAGAPRLFQALSK